VQSVRLVHLRVILSDFLLYKKFTAGINTSSLVIIKEQKYKTKYKTKSKAKQIKP
jgi:hypothetical protein